MLGLRRRWQSVVLLALSSLAVTCKTRPSSTTTEPPALGNVSVKPIPTVDFRGQTLSLDGGRLGESLKHVLAQTGVFANPVGSRATVAVTVEAIPFTEGTADALEIGIKLRLRMAVRPEGGAPAHFSEDVAAVGQAPLETKDVTAAAAAFQRLAERVASDLASAYAERQKLWSADADAVGRALGAEDSDLRVEGLRVVGTRRLHALAPAVVRMLADDDEGVRDAALAAVVALGDRSAIKALANSHQMRDSREMRKVIDAIAALGGTEAREYLTFVAETHDDEEIRDLAKAAITHLSRRANK